MSKDVKPNPEIDEKDPEKYKYKYLSLSDTVLYRALKKGNNPFRDLYIDMLDSKIKKQVMIEDIIKNVRRMEIDYGANGWPEIRMRDVSALCDTIVSLWRESGVSWPR